ncbi:unnamed protein product [Darwinula stevensoni]|uniref:Uncharacterized protein n=1 Tax=Darwinula stevensoni TaxID=69355 RepID=A0A7R8X9G3_9CRUS|nr:unnamed protein product [Darwinula stevensoni]CAG0882530.1 unnamed protein product [Darwinula stevensoni]
MSRKVNSDLYQRLSGIRGRINDPANANQPTLSEKLQGGLDLFFHYTYLSEVILAMETLRKSSEVSWECCMDICNMGGIDQFTQLLSSCNRSEPHFDIVQRSIAVLCNISRCPQTRHFIWHNRSLIEVMLAQGEHFWVVHPDLMSAICTTIQNSCKNNGKSLMFLQNNTTVVQRLRIVYKKWKRERHFLVKLSSKSGLRNSNMVKLEKLNALETVLIPLLRDFGEDLIEEKPD